MDGFVGSLDAAADQVLGDPDAADCDRILGPQGQPDVMSTLRRSSIPNYWSWADHFVLQDAMFASATRGRLPSHLFLISGWSASCPDPKDPMSCRSNLTLKRSAQRWDFGDRPIYGWTDVTWLLDRAGVSWRYYIGSDTCWEPPCPGERNRALESKSVFMPVAGFTSFWDGERGGIHDNLTSVHTYLRSASDGTLPDVSWIMPSSGVSDSPGEPEHDPHVDGLCDAPDQRRDAGSGLGLDRDLPDVGRLGRVLRPRATRADRRERLRPARARPGDQPVRQGGTSTTRSCRSTPT